MSPSHIQTNKHKTHRHRGERVSETQNISKKKKTKCLVDEAAAVAAEEEDGTPRHKTNTNCFEKGEVQE